MGVPSKGASKRLLQELSAFERLSRARTVRLALSGRTYGPGGKFQSTASADGDVGRKSKLEGVNGDGDSGGDDDDGRYDPIERLGPVADDLTHWEAVLQGIDQTAYAGGRWKLDIRIPDNYPNEPPVVTFLTRVCHPNVKFETGEICLDLLKTNWSPVYTIANTIMEIHQLLLLPVPDSPLNLEVAKLMRDGDQIAALGLIRYYTQREVYEGR